jgi:hypothetical protein
MSSYILKSVKNDLVQKWIKANAAGSVKGSTKDSWRAYLAANSGTGKTLHDLESSFLIAAGATGKTLHDKWSSYLAGLAVAGGKGNEKARNRYK